MRRFKNFNLAFKLCLVFVITLSIGIVASSLYATTISSYKIDAKVMSNGDMHVEEYLKYYFDEDINGVFRDILYKYTFENQKNNMYATSSRYQANGISNLKVYTSDVDFDNLTENSPREEYLSKVGDKGIYSLAQEIDKGKYRDYIKVYMPSNSGEYKYVKYEYDLEDVAVKYNDVGEIYWNFIGGDWQNRIHALDINVTFENPSMEPEKIKVYPHSYAEEITYRVDNNDIKISAKNISAHTAVDARIVFPGDTLVSAGKTINENYDYSLLNKIEKTMENDKGRYLLSEKISIILFIIGLLGIVAINIETNIIVKKGKKKDKDLEICTDILDKYSLGEYSTMLNRFGGYSSNNLLLATILDLSDRKFIIMEAEKKLKKDFLSNIEYDYNMKLNSEKDYSTLNEYEITIINYLFNGKAGNQTNITNFKLQSFELNKRLKELSKNYYGIMEYGRACQSLSNDENKKIYDKLPKKPLLYSCLFIFLLAVIYIGNMFIISPATNVNPLSLSLGMILMFFTIFSLPFILSARSIKEEYIEEYNRLMGLKKYLKEYSKLKDRYPIELVLWNKYLVFASLFGIANKVAKEFKEELISQGYDDDYIYMTYPCLNMSMHSDDINQSFASSTGSSSSGGYSGGGSGGGGGRRWRWRHFLTNHNNQNNRIIIYCSIILYIF